MLTGRRGLYSLLAKATLLAAALSIITILALTLFITKIMPIHMPPEDFAAWPTAKKEAYLYEHHTPSVHGIELLKRWIQEPEEAVSFISPQAGLVFPLSWIAAFLGGFWQMRSCRYNCSLKRTAAEGLR